MQILLDESTFKKRKGLIVFWTKYYGNDAFIDDGTEKFEFVNNFTNQMFKKCQPLANSCKLTNEKSLIHNAEGVIFHIRDISQIKWPTFRSPEQRWIFFNLESPLYTYHEEQLSLLPRHLSFNWTISYRYLVLLTFEISHKAKCEILDEFMVDQR